MNSKFKEFWKEFTRDVDLDYVDPEEVAEEAWNAAVDAVDNNITHRRPELDQDIWEIYVDNNE